MVRAPSMPLRGVARIQAADNVEALAKDGLTRIQIAAKLGITVKQVEGICVGFHIPTCGMRGRTNKKWSPDLTVPRPVPDAEFAGKKHGVCRGCDEEKRLDEFGLVPEHKTLGRVVRGVAVAEICTGSYSTPKKESK